MYIINKAVISTTSIDVHEYINETTLSILQVSLTYSTNSKRKTAWVHQMSCIRVETTPGYCRRFLPGPPIDHAFVWLVPQKAPDSAYYCQEKLHQPGFPFQDEQVGVHDEYEAHQVHEDVEDLKITYERNVVYVDTRDLVSKTNTLQYLERLHCNL